MVSPTVLSNSANTPVHPNRKIHAMKIATRISLFALLAFAALAQNNVSFVYQIGGTVPSAQQYSITTQFAPLNLSVSTTGEPWLLTSLSSTVTPSILTIAINPEGVT